MKKPKILMFGIDGGAAYHIKRQVELGKLPGFARVMKNGVFFDDMMSVFPTISPTCWHSIYTGAVPKVHGAICEMIHHPGEDPWHFGTSYSDANVHADRMWDVVARHGGKSLLLGLLGGGADDIEKVTAVRCTNLHCYPDKPAADYELTGVVQQYFSIRKIDDTTLYARSVSMPSGGWKNIDSDEARHVLKRVDKTRKIEDDVDLGDWNLVDGEIVKKAGENAFEFQVIREANNHNTNEIEPFSWTLIVEDGGVKIGENAEKAAQNKLFAEHEWSDVLQRRLKTETGEYATFTFRAYCEQFDKENQIYGIYITACRNFLKEVSPKSKAEAMMNIPEIEMVCYGDMLKNGDKFIESMEFKCSWRQQAIMNEIKNDEYDLIFDYFGSTDSLNHSEVSAYYGLTNVNLEDKFTHERAVSDFERVYKIVDDHLTWLYDNVCDENTIICICADHGAIATIDDYYPMEILKNAGLTTYIDYDFNKLNWRNEGIDWSKTKAYCVGCCHINVNLKGREPCGIVEPEDYDKVVKEIIVALHEYGLTHSGTHKGEFAFVVPGDQAGFIGLGGECCGDVVYGIMGGEVGGYFGDVHAVQIPSAKNKYSDERPVCIMGGKGLKKDFLLKRPTDLTDIAPTVLYAAGYTQTKDATGGIVFAALEDN